MKNAFLFILGTIGILWFALAAACAWFTFWSLNNGNHYLRSIKPVL
jgi:hypothetical protein